MTLQRSSDIVETTRIEFLAMPPVWVIVLVIIPALFVFCRWVYSRERDRGAWWWLPAVASRRSGQTILPDDGPGVGHGNPSRSWRRATYEWWSGRWH